MEDSKPTSVDPLPDFNFQDKKFLRDQTREHRKKIYKILILKGVRPSIAKYAYRLNFIERPSSDAKNQPEFKFTIDSYTKKFIERVPNAKNFLEENLKYFQEAQDKYFVDKETVASLMLLESNLGVNKGKLNILDALFTMSHPYVSKRSKFFTEELTAAFKLMGSSKYFFKNTTMGSWAGAMGYVQFIPSSVLAYAVDGDADGKIDIINSKVDAIHSAANFLQHANWQQGALIAKEIDHAELKNVDLCQTIGKSFQDGTLKLEQLEPERYFVTYQNYNSLIRWNRSFVFAYTVQLITNELKK